MNPGNIQEMIHEAAVRFPERGALSGAGATLSYAQLEARSNSLANFLIRSEAVPGSIVVILSEDIPLSIVAILGVLKAGCVFVPLDPATPVRRLAAMLSDLEPQWCLTDEHFLPLLSGIAMEAGPSPRTISLTSELLEESADSSYPGLAHDPEQMAYVYFTSGSTGKPKGIAGRLKGIDHFIRWQIETLGLDETVRVSQLLPLSFDGSLRDLFIPLATGGCICVPPTRAVLLEPEQLIKWLEQEAVTVMHCVPSLWRSLINAGLVAEQLPQLRSVVMAGEAVLVADVARWQAVFGERIELINLYGTSETTMAKFWHRIRAADCERPSIPIGKPIRGARALILDERGRVCPVGTVGEIYIRTPYRALGYYRQEEMTREVFVQNPFSTDPDDIVYRTGDLGRALKDGNYEYVGRKDQQVKVRGVRVELGEVENVLREHAGVRDVAVVDREDGSGNKYLCAYVVVAEGMENGELREHAQGMLPEYMVPGSYIEMEKLPRTLSGKIDRRALPSNGQVQTRRRSESLADAIEQAARKGHGVQLPPIEVVSRERRLPLSFAQQRLWFLDQLEPQQVAYNMPLGVRFIGRLRPAILEQALTEIVRRHESLRTSFPSPDGEPQQQIAAPARVTLPLIDLSHLDGDEQQAQVARLAQAEAQRAFDLAHGPLLRVRLLRLSTDEHAVLLTMHHIISDGWSMGILVREVGALYAAYSAGEVSPLTELEVQYADYAVWEKEWLRGEMLEEQRSYWREQLSDAPAVLELPTDYPRTAVLQQQGRVQSIGLSEELSAELQKMSRAHGVTLFMTLLAGWQVLLSRYARQQQVVVGTPIAGRRQLQTEELIGFFVNTLPLRTEVRGELSVAGLLARVRETVLEAYAHQDVPFEKLVEELQPERSLSHTPLFQVMFVLQNTRREELLVSGLRMEIMDGETETAKFEMTLGLAESERGIEGTLRYNRELYADETMRRMAGHYERVLAEMVREPEQKVSEIRILGESEEAELLVEYNRTEREYASQVCIHEMFEEQAGRTPEAIAVVYEDEQLSYAELNNRANRLAHYLRSEGVGGETLVGICVERSLEMVVGLLGILKAGGAYVPLDPAYPRKRLSFMVEDSGAKVVIVQERLREMFAGNSSVRVLSVDGEWDEIEKESREEIEREWRSGGRQETAYVIYTSGSTGTPKGVVVTHRNITNYAQFICEKLHVHELPVGDVLHFATVSTIAADLGNTCVFPSLISGGCLHVLGYDIATDADSFAAYVSNRPIDVLKIVPSHLNSLLAANEGVNILPRKYLILGGEAFSLDLLERVRARADDCQVINHYGPTETTVGSLTFSIPEERSTWTSSTVPIGRPIANTEVYILDEHLKPVPVGVPGQIFIGGAGLSAGYLKKPEQTATRFIPNPFSTNGNTRLYQTGDLARLLPEGEIEYIGRQDEQVKFHGYRVELNEIRGVINQHPQIRDSVVVVTQDMRGNDVMIAYYVSRQELDPGQLRSFLAESIIEETIPNVFVHLKRMPLTLNGKISYQALPTLEEARKKLKQEYVAPQTPLEEILAGIWSEVLSLERVGVEDNFFTVGGHSLLATQVVSRIHHLFNVELPLRALFESPTVAGMSERVEAAQRGAPSVSVPPLGDREQALPLSFAQQRLWFLDQLNPGSATYNIPLAVRLSGRLNVPALERSLTEIVCRHESLRTTFLEVDRVPVQIIGEAKAVTILVENLSPLPQAEREAEAQRLISEEAARPFNLAQGPVLRAGLLNLGEEEHIFLLTMHHIVSDGWSMGVLIREFDAHYRAFSRGQEAELPPLPIQYADYAAWQREWLQGEVLEAQLGYWKRQLGGNLPVLELPTDRPRPSVQTHQGATCSFELSAETSERLKALSRREGVTLFMTLLASFNLLLARYTGQEDIVIGTPIAGRNRLETEGLIGFFVNTLVLRTDLAGDPTFRELLHRIREVALAAHLHQDLPFEKLVEELQPERDMSRQPLFQVMFALRNWPRENLELSGLRLSRVRVTDVTAKFDLMLVMEDADQELSGSIEYNSDLFDQSTIKRMCRHFENLLASIVANPDGRLNELKMLSKEEHFLLEQAIVVEEFDNDFSF